MATLKQRKAIEAMVENGGAVMPAMIQAGYSPATAHTPGKLTNSGGFKELLVEYGLTESLVITALVDDIKGKPKQRVKELGLASEILGLKKHRDEFGSVFNLNIINVEQLHKMAEHFLKKQLDDQSQTN